MIGKYITALSILLVSLSLTASYTFAQVNYALIPYPKSLEPVNGEFYINKHTVINSASKERFSGEINQLNELPAKSLKSDLKVLKTTRQTKRSLV
jgi:hypothetical protein